MQLNDKNIEEKVKKMARNKASDITQPLVSTENPETCDVSGETLEVAKTSYRDALLPNPEGSTMNIERHKHKYERRLPEQKTKSSATRSGRVSRPPDRL